jgi:acyl dehydratase
VAAAEDAQSTGPSRVVTPQGGVTTLLRAALPSLPLVSQLPGVRKASPSGFGGLTVSRPPVVVERDRVDAYAKVCGFPTKDTVPLTYPHMLAFGLHMAIMGDPAFPAPAIGTVHLENSITSRRPIAVGETLAVSTSVGGPQPHPKGTTYVFTTTVTADGETVWDSASTYLRRGRGDESASFGTAFPDAEPGGLEWRLPADLGRRYAAVSGDHNPIHLYPLTARALGFKRQIAHGMWTKARCVAALENRLPDAVTVAVGFRKPVFLPSAVSFGSRAVDGGWAFSLSAAGGSGVTHLVGQAVEA